MTNGARRWFIILGAMVLATGLPRYGSAQPAPASTWTPEVSVGIGVGHVFRFEDRTFGNEPNITAAAAIRHRHLGLEVEANGTLGLTPARAACGIIVNGEPAACQGSAREGVLDAAIVSFTIQYQFAEGRVRPYLLGGLGIMRASVVSSTTTVRDGVALQTERVTSDTGVGPDLGAGLSVRVSRHVSISPEVRWLEASWLSRPNLAVTRSSVRAAYSW